jgi:sodium ion-translocating decarboxylase beta subunit
MEIFEKLFNMTALGGITPGMILMWLIGTVLLFLGIHKKYEPLLLVPIAFGLLIANFPGVLVSGEPMGVVSTEQAPGITHLTMLEIAKEYGIINFVYYSLIKTGFLPPVIFMGVGALTDFGPMLRNLRLAFFGAAAQIGIFTVLICALLVGFSIEEAASLGIIGGADGPTAIYTTIILADHLLGPVAIAAYSYMALVPVIIPLVVKMTCNTSELQINMKLQDKLFPGKIEIKNIKTVKIIFPIVLSLVIGLIVPSALPLAGMLLFGNLIKEIGTSTERLSNEQLQGRL